MQICNDLLNIIEYLLLDIRCLFGGIIDETLSAVCRVSKKVISRFIQQVSSIASELFAGLLCGHYIVVDTCLKLGD